MEEKEEEEKEKELPSQPKVEGPPIVASNLHPTELNTLDVPPEVRKVKAEMAILEEANRLFDRTHYDKAIKLYQRLAGTTYEEEGKQRIQEAMDRFANNGRKESVKIFVKAKKSSDPEEKKVLLYKAKEILEDINERYPTNLYAAKVRSHIEAVVKEIKKVDPDFTE